MPGREDTSALPPTTTVTAFDEYIETKSSGVSVYTSAALDDVLGFYDQLAIEVTVNDVRAGTAPAHLYVRIGHSADGIHYLWKSPTPEVNAPTQLSLTDTTYMDIGFEDGAIPSLGMVRLAITLGAAAGPVRAHVRVVVTGNNFDEPAFSRAVSEAKGEQSYGNRTYVVRYDAGTRVDTKLVSELVQTIRGLPHISNVDLLRFSVHPTHDSYSGTPLDDDGDRADAWRVYEIVKTWGDLIKMNNDKPGWLSGTSMKVPANHAIGFLPNGHYVFLKHEGVIWGSTQASAALDLFPRREYQAAAPTAGKKGEK